ncbi:MAG: nucleotidyl transferase AbiEii/AbiGii toxin family protein [Candidatus Micrarchaeaceae archaeon]
MDAPLELLLKNKEYLEIAKLQDEVISRLYNIDAKLTLHGGTSIWRCYGSKRFSYDLDLYVRSHNEIARLVENLRRYGINVKNIRMRRGGGYIVYYTVSNDHTSITLEFSHKRAVERILATYTKVDGSSMDIFSLSPEALMSEKMAAYRSRRAVKDIYDIYILSHIVRLNKTRLSMSRFLSEMKPPIDENVLRQLIYDGPIPSTKEIVDYIKRRYEIR